MHVSKSVHRLPLIGETLAKACVPHARETGDERSYPGAIVTDDDLPSLAVHLDVLSREKRIFFLSHSLYLTRSFR